MLMVLLLWKLVMLLMMLLLLLNLLMMKVLRLYKMVVAESLRVEAGDVAAFERLH